MGQKGISRRRFLASAAASGAAASFGNFACSSPSQAPPAGGAAHPAPKGRVIILGFDGIEPNIVGPMMDAGELPNFAKLRDQGSFKRLGSTIPPQSPVAWTSFSTCKNPGGHNIFDFIRRNPRSPNGPIPLVGTGRLNSASFDGVGNLVSGPSAVAYRKGKTFWSVADEQGLRCKVFNVPFAFPADRMQKGIQLCGLGVPDLRGTTSYSFSLADDFTAAQMEEPLSGGERIKLEFDGRDETVVQVPGPRGAKGLVYAPLKLSVDRNARVGVAEVGGKKVELVPGQWSAWLEWEFPLADRLTAYSITRFYPLEIGERVRLYMTCQQFHPARPFVPFSHPDEYSARLVDRYGLYKTIGWSYDTHGLRQDFIDEAAFMADVREGMAWRERLTLDEMDRGEFDILVFVWEATDRVGHMYWRYRDPQHPMYDPEKAAVFGKALEESYQIADRIVGNVMGRLKENDLFMVISDHGFESWRTGFNVNTWLQQQGYLAVTSMQEAEKGFLQGIDWSKTKAYSVGLSSLFVNLSGRESKGIVPRTDADNLIAEIRDKLIEAKDPLTGLKLFSAMYTRNDFKGEAMADAPDIVFGYDRFYQSSKSCAGGGVTEFLYEANEDKWSGEHAASDVAWIPGIFFCNRKVESDTPNILDIGVSALRFLERDVPADYEGVSLI